MIIVKPSPELMSAKDQPPVWIPSRNASLADLQKGVAYHPQDAEFLLLKQEHENLIRAGYIQIIEHPPAPIPFTLAPVTLALEPKKIKKGAPNHE